MAQRRIGVFIISPNDVKEEREIVKKVCHTFNHHSLFSFILEPVAWEDYPFEYQKNPQQNIDPYLEQAEIFIVILWHRLGTPVEGCKGAITGETDVTGTQYEIEKILAMGKENIFFYLKNKKRLFLEEELVEAAEQKRKLDHFLKKMGIQPGSTKRSYHTFDTPKMFEEKLKKHLSRALYRLTGEKMTQIGKKSHSRFFSYLFGVLMLVMLIPGGWVGFYLLDKKEQHSLSSVTSNKNNKEIRETPSIRKNRLYVEADQFRLPTKTIPHVIIVSDETKADYLLNVSYDERIREYTIAGQNMVAVHCMVAYDVKKRNRNKRIQSGMFDAEAIDFDITAARNKCKKKAQYTMALQLKSVLGEDK